MITNLHEWQTAAARTIVTSHGFERNLTEFCFGIGAESGELQNYLKKVMFQGHVLDQSHVSEELGDILWYLTAIATLFGIDLQDVVAKNESKRAIRYPNGFSEADSIARRDII